MTEINGDPHEFKIPAIPEVTSNVIPTGKQIPRTPIRPAKEKKQVKEFHAGPVLFTSLGQVTLCYHEITKTKNCIPKGKEIPRTPLPGKERKRECFSSCQTFTSSLPEVDSGVHPLNNPDENDDIDFKIEASIFKGHVTLRSSRKKAVDENNLRTSKESFQNCKSSSNPLSKHAVNCKRRDRKDCTEKLCKNLETKCDLVQKSPLSIIDPNNRNSNVRCNPPRRAKKNVNYKI